MKPTREPDASNPEGLRKHLEQVNKVLSNISFGSSMNNTDREQNMECWKATATSPGTPNTEFSISHGLNRIPFGVFVVGQTAAAHLYRSASAWTNTTIFVKSDQIGVIFSVIIV